MRKGEIWGKNWRIKRQSKDKYEQREMSLLAPRCVGICLELGKHSGIPNQSRSEIQLNINHQEFN